MQVRIDADKLGEFVNEHTKPGAAEKSWE